MKTYITLLAFVASTKAGLLCNQANWENLKENDYIPKSWKEYYLLHKPPSEDNRIVGGEIVKPNSVPHQAGLGLMRSDGARSWCGGSVISDRFILTAAHCLDRMDSVLVMLGAHDRTNNDEPGRLNIKVDSKDFIIHKKYDMQRITNDIALIRLPEPIKFSEKIQPISLPKLSQEKDNFVGRKAIISGWGKYEANRLSQHLRSAESTVVNDTICKEYFGYLITESVICLDGGDKRGTCHGDSGGPMVIREDDSGPFIAGLTSFGNPYSCQAGWPTAYTRITSFLKWISQKTKISLE